MPFRQTIKAFMVDPDAPRPGNPIHSTDTARKHGFRGALIGGANVYGWVTDAIVDLLGESWLSNGWIDVLFRKPTYDGDTMQVTIDDAIENIHQYRLENQQGDVCLEGQLGMNTAPWLNEIEQTEFEPAEDPITDSPALTLDNAPVGQRLRPMSAALTVRKHEAFIKEKQGALLHRYAGPEGLCHPAWLAAQMIYLLHHSFNYGPAIHTRSQIQNLAPANAAQSFTITGCCDDAFEKRGHHYIVNDGSIWSGAQCELVRLRHTAIFKLRTAD
ncbi:MAG: hypothetical protein QGH99_02015 [Pseudomonadales bacterium]|nr:hypothetical protein [Pseudomonadales bacterium]HJP52703.1 hypothetical protein [Pseudomonadales bacterium]